MATPTPRLTVAARERDAAINEAAKALFRVRRLEEDLRQMRCELDEAHTQRDRASRKQPQPRPADDRSNGASALMLCVGPGVDNPCSLIMCVCAADHVVWQLQHVSSALWTAWQESSGLASLEQVRLHVLQAVEEFIPPHEQHLYEEMHGLYTRTVQLQQQNTRLESQLKTTQQSLRRHNHDSVMGCRGECVQAQAKMAREHEEHIQYLKQMWSKEQQAQRAAWDRERAAMEQTWRELLSSKDSKINELVVALEEQNAEIAVLVEEHQRIRSPTGKQRHKRVVIPVDPSSAPLSPRRLAADQLASILQQIDDEDENLDAALPEDDMESPVDMAPPAMVAPSEQKPMASRPLAETATIETDSREVQCTLIDSSTATQETVALQHAQLQMYARCVERRKRPHQRVR